MYTGTLNYHEADEPWLKRIGITFIGAPSLRSGNLTRRCCMSEETLEKLTTTVQINSKRWMAFAWELEKIGPKERIIN
jgi:hypothetical protein